MCILLYRKNIWSFDKTEEECCWFYQSEKKGTLRSLVFCSGLSVGASSLIPSVNTNLLLLEDWKKRKRRERKKKKIIFCSRKVSTVWILEMENIRGNLTRINTIKLYYVKKCQQYKLFGWNREYKLCDLRRN